MELALGLFLMIISALILGRLFELMRLPALLGEVLAGILLGSYVLHWVMSNHLYEILGILGSIILLFTVGLETNLRKVGQVGREAGLTALLGMIFPFGLILGAAFAFHHSSTIAIFLATAGTATSVGITARILKDSNALTMPASRVILGAAVLDDIFGIALLAVVSSYVRTGTLRLLDTGLVMAQIIAFVLIALLFLPKVIKRLEKVHLGENTVFILALVTMLLLSLISEYLGLAAIIGAFFAGLTFAESRNKERIQERMRPLSFLLVPLFFVGIGLTLDVHALLSPATLLFGSVITVLAIAGKLAGGRIGASGLGMHQAITVGIGMVPRGEVGLIIGNIGYRLGIIGTQEVAVIVFMSLLTTFITPFFLIPRLRSRKVAGLRS
jgi:Kef-type K+ transport system membrane component KefB